MRNNKNKGFTLVELLVVIAILAILATVSVVGYTSFIESATVSNDENIAAQLNNFLVAMKADSNGKYYDDFTANDGKVTEDNVWEITQYILKDGGLESLEPQALKYGYNYYYNLNTQKFEVIKEKDVTAPGLVAFIRAFANGETLKPGFFKTKTGDVVFLVDTKGSSLAEAVRGFYTFDHIEGTNKFDTFQNIVSELGAEHQNIKDAAQNSVFVTTEGTKVVEGLESATNYVFHTEEGIVMGTSVSVTLSNPVTVPDNVTSFEVGAFDVTYTENGNLVFEASAETLKSALCEDSLPASITIVVDGKTWTYVSATATEDAKLTTGTDKIYLDITNPLADFDIELIGENTTQFNNKALNEGILVWDGEEFQLALKNLVAADTTKTLSSRRVKWELTDVDGKSATYAGISLAADGKITLNVDSNTTLYPATTEFYVTATAAHKADDAESYAKETFKVILSRPKYAEIKVDGSATNNSADTLKGALGLLYGELSSSGTKNTYGVTTSIASGADGHTNFFANAEYDETVKITVVNNSNFTESNKTLTASANLFAQDSNNDGVIDANDTPLSSKEVVIKVRIGDYVEYDITLTLFNTKFLFEKVSSNMSVLGTEGDTIKVTDLFKMIDGVTLPDGVTAHVNAYYAPDANANITDLKTLGSPIVTGSSNTYTYSETKNSIAYTDTTSGFNFAFPGTPTKTTTDQLVFVVTLTDRDGKVVRGSDNFVVNIVNAANVRDYASLKHYLESVTKTTTTSEVTYDANNKNHVDSVKVSASTLITVTTKKINGEKFVTTVDKYTGMSVVMLNDITLGSIPSDFDKTIIPEADKDLLYVLNNNTLYGNGCTLNIKAGKHNSDGVIQLKDAHLRDLRLIGEVYEDFGERMGEDYSSALIYSTGTSTITNSYLANGRSNVRVGGGKFTAKDTVFFGGRYANIDFITGELKLEGTVVTVQQPYNDDTSKDNVIGGGIICYFQDNYNNINLDTDTVFKQYNFLSSNTTGNLPTLYGTISIKDPFDDLLDDKNKEKYKLFRYGTDSDPYVNASIMVVDKYIFDWSVSRELAPCDCSVGATETDPDKHSSGFLGMGMCNYKQSALGLNVSWSVKGYKVTVTLKPSVSVDDTILNIHYNKTYHYIDISDYATGYFAIAKHTDNTTEYVDLNGNEVYDNGEKVVKASDTLWYVDTDNNGEYTEGTDKLLLKNDTTNGILTLGMQNLVKGENINYIFRWNQKTYGTLNLTGYTEYDFNITTDKSVYEALHTTNLNGYGGTDYTYDGRGFISNIIGNAGDLHTKDIHSLRVIFDIKSTTNDQYDNRELFKEYQNMSDSTKTDAYRYYAPEKYDFENGSIIHLYDLPEAEKEAKQ